MQPILRCSFTLSPGIATTDLESLDELAQEYYQSVEYVVEAFESYLSQGHRQKDRAEVVYNRNTRSHECDLCAKSCGTRAGAKLHTQSPVHDPRVFKCPECDDRFKVLSALVQHVESDRCTEGIEEGTGSIGDMLHYLWLQLS